MTITNAIRVALENHLNTTPASPAPTLPDIAWPNVPYTRVKGTPYIRVEFIPVLRRPAVVGPNPEHRQSGLFYLTVYTPEDAGADAGMALVDKLLARFNGHDSIGPLVAWFLSGGKWRLTGIWEDSLDWNLPSAASVRIEYSEAKMPLHDPPFYAIPVEIGWHSYSG